MRAIRSLLLSGLGAVLLTAPATLPAQVPATDASDFHLSREALQARLAEYESTSGAGARSEAALIRRRLQEGDFQVGDQVELRVEGEEALTQTFSVARGRVLELPTIGAIPLEGVLRSELQSHLQTELAKYIRDPQVQANALFRITVTGGVGQPGFYVLRSDALLTEALMRAGGPGTGADLKKIRVERAGNVIWSGDALQQAITEGRTLDQLSLQAGDHLFVPQTGGGPGVWTYLGTAASAIAAIATIARLF